MSKLDTLMESEGFTDLTSFLDACICDSISPGICMNAECDYTTEVEPDSQEGYCEVCGTQTVKSALILAGLI